MIPLPVTGHRAQEVSLRTETKDAEKDKKDEGPTVLYSEALPFLTRRASLGPVGAYVGDYVSFNSK